MCDKFTCILGEPFECAFLCEFKFFFACNTAFYSVFEILMFLLCQKPLSPSGHTR